MYLAHRLRISWTLVLAAALLACSAAAQASPASDQWLQKQHEREIGRIVGQLDETDGSVEYLLFVILPVLGLIGLLAALRHRFFN